MLCTYLIGYKFMALITKLEWKFITFNLNMGNIKNILWNIVGPTKNVIDLNNVMWQCKETL